jgi:hypothetical protein
MQDNASKISPRPLAPDAPGHPLNSTIPENIRAIVDTMLALLMTMHEAARHQHATAPHPTGIYPVTLLIDAAGNVVGDEQGLPVLSIPLVFAGFDHKDVPRFEHPDQLIKRSDAAKLAATSTSTLKRSEGMKPGELRPVKVSMRDTSYNFHALREWMLRRARGNVS